jgi:hypothetical protein
MASSSVPSRVLFSILLACLLNGVCVAFNSAVAFNRGFARMSPHVSIVSPRKAFNLRMQDSDSTSTGVTKGFSNRREQQKADTLMRQKSKQAKIEKLQSDEPAAEPVPENTAADVPTESAPLRKVSNPKALEKLKDATQLEKEKRLMAAKQAGLPMIDRVGQGLPLIEKVLLIRVACRLKMAIEKIMFSGAGSARQRPVFGGAGAFRRGGDCCDTVGACGRRYRVRGFHGRYQADGENGDGAACESDLRERGTDGGVRWP